METSGLHIGIRGREETVVTEDLLAKNVGSGLVRVYATAMMIALIEKAAVFSVEPYLEPGQGTVGIHVDVSHCYATTVRGTGLGRKLLHEGVQYAIEKMGAERLYLEAQTYAVGFYRKEGFAVCSGEFLEDGIPHVRMRREAKP